MSNVVRARILGDDYQALVFWVQVCRMLQEPDHIIAVEIESNDLKSFDDIVVRYKMPQSDSVCPYILDCYQVKFHVDYQGSITAGALTDRSFVHSKKFSFLQRAYQVWQQSRQEGVRIIFYSSWPIDSNDILSSLVSAQDTRFYLMKFDGKKWKRKNDYQSLLQKWMLHVGVSNQTEMLDFLKCLRIESGVSLATLEGILNDKLKLVGLRPVLNGKFNSYLEVARCFIKGNVVRLSKEEIITVCKQNELWTGHPLVSSPRKKIGIKAMREHTEWMAKWADVVCDLTNMFEGRELLNDFSWSDDVVTQVSSFLSQELLPGVDCELWIAAHTTIALLCGYVLNAHSGISVSLIQNGNGRQTWIIPSYISRLNQATCTVEITKIEKTPSRDLAVAVSISNDVYADVCSYVKKTRMAKWILHLRHLSCGPCAIADVSAAIECVEEIMHEVKRIKMEYNPSAHLHFFVSAPNTVSFILGQRFRGLGFIHIYEFDNERCHDGTYQPSLQFPLKKG